MRSFQNGEKGPQTKTSGRDVVTRAMAPQGAWGHEDNAITTERISVSLTLCTARQGNPRMRTTTTAMVNEEPEIGADQRDAVS